MTGYVPQREGGHRPVQFRVNNITGHISDQASPWILRIKHLGVIIFSPALLAGKIARDALALIAHTVGALLGIQGANPRREGTKLLRTIPLLFLLPGSAMTGLVNPAEGAELVADLMRWANCQESPAQYWQEYHRYFSIILYALWIPACFQPKDNLYRPINGGGQPKRPVYDEVASSLLRQRHSNFARLPASPADGDGWAWSLNERTIYLNGLVDTVIRQIGHLPPEIPQLDSQTLQNAIVGQAGPIPPLNVAAEQLVTLALTTIGEAGRIQAQLNGLARALTPLR